MSCPDDTHGKATKERVNAGTAAREWEWAGLPDFGKWPGGLES
jgi:hypothetical protein